MDTHSQQVLSVNQEPISDPRTIFLQGLLSSIQNRRIDTNGFLNLDKSEGQPKRKSFWDLFWNLTSINSQPSIFFDSNTNVKIYYLKNRHWVNI